MENGSNMEGSDRLILRRSPVSHTRLAVARRRVGELDDARRVPFSQHRLVLRPTHAPCRPLPFTPGRRSPVREERARLVPTLVPQIPLQHAPLGALALRRVRHRLEEQRRIELVKGVQDAFELVEAVAAGEAEARAADRAGRAQKVVTGVTGRDGPTA